MSENIVKATAKALGMTYKQLGDAVGYGEGTINNAAATGKVSEPLKKAIELYLETLELKKELQTLEQLKIIINSLVITK